VQADDGIRARNVTGVQTCALPISFLLGGSALGSRSGAWLGPKCRLERISMDLSDLAMRRSYFRELNPLARKIVVLSEGLLIYFTPEEVAALARDLSMGSHFSSWIIDLASPGQLKLMQRTTGKRLSEAGAAFKFGPSERADFFVPHGWQPKEVKGLLETAVHFKRTPSEMLAWLPGPMGTPGDHPWTGVCLL